MAAGLAPVPADDIMDIGSVVMLNDVFNNHAALTKDTFLAVKVMGFSKEDKHAVFVADLSSHATIVFDVSELQYKLRLVTGKCYKLYNARITDIPGVLRMAVGSYPEELRPEEIPPEFSNLKPENGFISFDDVETNYVNKQMVTQPLLVKVLKVSDTELSNPKRVQFRKVMMKDEKGKIKNLMFWQQLYLLNRRLLQVGKIYLITGVRKNEYPAEYGTKKNFSLTFEGSHYTKIQLVEDEHLTQRFNAYSENIVTMEGIINKTLSIGRDPIVAPKQCKRWDLIANANNRETKIVLNLYCHHCKTRLKCDDNPICPDEKCSKEIIEDHLIVKWWTKVIFRETQSGAMFEMVAHSKVWNKIEFTAAEYYELMQMGIKAPGNFQTKEEEEMFVATLNLAERINYVTASANFILRAVRGRKVIVAMKPKDTGPDAKPNDDRNVLVKIEMDRRL